MRLSNFVQNLFGVLGGILVGFYFDWLMTLISMAVIVVLLFTQVALLKFAQKQANRDLHAADELNNVLHSIFSRNI